MSDRNITRLPKWAQAKISSLEQKIERLQANLEERDEYIAAQHPGTNVRYSVPSALEEDRPLPKDAEVDFYLKGSTEKYYDMISVRPVRHGDPIATAIYISGGSHGLIIKPISGNAIEVRNADR